VLRLPAIDKFIYTLSWLPWKKHYIAGTAFMYHYSLQNTLTDRFMTAFHACLKMGSHWNKNICGSDQVILSHIRNKHEDFFYQIGYGYGVLIHRMFMDHSPISNITTMADLCYEQNGNVPLFKNFHKTYINNMCAEAWGIDVVPEDDNTATGTDAGKKLKAKMKKKKIKNKSVQLPPSLLKSRA
jgi:hypothetical protein